MGERRTIIPLITSVITRMSDSARVDMSKTAVDCGVASMTVFRYEIPTRKTGPPRTNTPVVCVVFTFAYAAVDYLIAQHIFVRTGCNGRRKNGEKKEERTLHFSRRPFSRLFIFRKRIQFAVFSFRDPFAGVLCSVRARINRLNVNAVPYARCVVLVVIAPVARSTDYCRLDGPLTLQRRIERRKYFW